MSNNNGIVRQPTMISSSSLHLDVDYNEFKIQAPHLWLGLQSQKLNLCAKELTDYIGFEDGETS